MEEPKINNTKKTACFALCANEERSIAICNAASIAVMKTLKDFGLSLSKTTVMEIKSDAIYSALTHINPETEGALSYANKCGRTSVLQALKYGKKKNSKKISYDTSKLELTKLADNWRADTSLLLREEEEEKERKERCLKHTIENLSDAERSLLELFLRDLRYKEIAKVLNCSEATARKRSYDLRKRIKLSLEKQGFNAA